MHQLCNLAFSWGVGNQWTKAGALLYDYDKHTCIVSISHIYLGTLFGKPVLDSNPPYLHGDIFADNGSTRVGNIITSENGTYVVKIDALPYGPRALLIVKLEDADEDNGLSSEGSVDKVHEERTEHQDKRE